MDEKNDPPPPSLRELFILFGEAEAAFGVDRLPRPARPVVEPCSEEPLAVLERKAVTCTACPLSEHRIQVVFGAGNPQASLLFVGEAPGAEEDRAGHPFVGKAGQLLTRMIQAMGYTREQVYIGNVIKCRPPGNRTPNAVEIGACRGFLEEQIRIIAPRVIVALGAPASRTILGREEGINALRGRVYPYPKDPKIQVVPTFHPAYLLRDESEKGKVWQDLQRAMEILAS